MQGSAHPTFDPLGGLRAAAAAREAAGLRRHLVPRVAGDAALRVLRADPGLPRQARLAAARLAAAAAELGLTVTAPAAAGSGRRGVPAADRTRHADGEGHQRGVARTGRRARSLPSLPEYRTSGKEHP